MKIHDDPEVAAYLAEMNALREEAAAKMKPWTSRKPTGLPAFWLGARWQQAGFYHVQFYDRESIGYLRQQGDQLWSGPYPAKADWMQHAPRPDPPAA